MVSHIVSQPDISQITDYLFISAWPKGEHQHFIVRLGIRLIISLHWRRPSRALEYPPLQLLWMPTVDNPLFPMPMSVFLRGVDVALPLIHEGGRVLVHCKAGVHRSVAMACCILISTGCTFEEAMQLVKAKRAAADPDIWYIRSRIQKFERVWKNMLDS